MKNLGRVVLTVCTLALLCLPSFSARSGSLGVNDPIIVDGTTYDLSSYYGEIFFIHRMAMVQRFVEIGDSLPAIGSNISNSMYSNVMGKVMELPFSDPNFFELIDLSSDNLKNVVPFIGVYDGKKYEVFVSKQIDAIHDESGYSSDCQGRPPPCRLVVVPGNFFPAWVDSPKYGRILTYVGAIDRRIYDPKTHLAYGYKNK